MAVVLLERMRSYGAIEAIKRFVADAVRLDPLVIDALHPRGRVPRVVVKPNWVHQAHQLHSDVWEPLITHPAVVLAVVEVLAEELGGRGLIAICDAPISYADFAAITGRGQLQAGLARIRSRWPSLTLEVLDLRREVWVVKDDVVVERRPNQLDPGGYVALDLGRDSLLHGHRGEGRYYGADYDAGAVNRHHRGAVQEYLLSGTALACDLFVNVAKLKTHKKTGITCCLKNLVGINGDKNWLPHHTEGAPCDGGDEFPEQSFARGLESALKSLGRRAAVGVPLVGPWAYRHVRRAGTRVLGDSRTTIRNGNWEGNDTCWRMALDLNRALLYGRRDGSWRDSERRPYLGIVDGIVGGEGNGPLAPDPVESGVMLAGADPAAVDAAACRLMGFEPDSIPLVRHAFESHRWPIAAGSIGSVRIVDRLTGTDVPLCELGTAAPRGFRPHFGWARLAARGSGLAAGIS